MANDNLQKKTFSRAKFLSRFQSAISTVGWGVASASSYIGSLSTPSNTERLALECVSAAALFTMVCTSICGRSLKKALSDHRETLEDSPSPLPPKKASAQSKRDAFFERYYIWKY